MVFAQYEECSEPAGPAIVLQRPMHCLFDGMLFSEVRNLCLGVKPT